MSPARAARAPRSSAASIALSRRGASPTRPAAVRPVSSTISTCRSRSGRHVRTTTSAARAVARQSMERTSSPMTYSRSESNSVPCPRTITAVRPSSSRSRASRDGRCLRDANGGSARTDHGAAWLPCRAASPSGPIERTVTRSARRSPRRVGVSATDSRRRSPAGTVIRCRVGTAPALGGHASRTTARSVRGPGLATASSTCTVPPSRTAVSPERRSCSAETGAASSTSTSTPSSSPASTPRKVGSPGDNPHTTAPMPATSTSRPVSATVAPRCVDQGQKVAVRSCGTTFCP